MLIFGFVRDQVSAMSFTFAGMPFAIDDCRDQIGFVAVGGVFLIEHPRMMQRSKL
jgi:hypothetical protein